jgi:hypothetical protein
MTYSPKRDSILLGYSIGSADLDEGRLEIVADGVTVRFTVTGHEGYVDLDLSGHAQEAYEEITGRESVTP